MMTGLGWQFGRAAVVAVVVAGGAAGPCWAQAETSGTAVASGRARDAATTPALTYTNPLPVPLADPAALRHKGLYYLTGTGFWRWVSPDLVHWRRSGDYVDPRGTWQRGWPWAAELAERGGRFFYYFSSPGNGVKNRCICVADAARPDAMFRPLAFPMWNDGCDWIDAHVFADRDGTRYLYATKDSGTTDGAAEIWVGRLARSMDRLDGPMRFCTRPSQPWEKRWQEGATVLRHGSTYYLMFSSNCFAGRDYSVGFATAPSPLGPWTKSRHNPILKAVGDVSGPGHNGVARSPDGRELFALYHTHIGPKGGGDRQLCIDRLRFAADPGYPDRMVIDGPTTTTQPQKMPSGAGPAGRGRGGSAKPRR